MVVFLDPLRHPLKMFFSSWNPFAEIFVPGRRNVAKTKEEASLTAAPQNLSIIPKILNPSAMPFYPCTSKGVSTNSTTSTTHQSSNSPNPQAMIFYPVTAILNVSSIYNDRNDKDTGDDGTSRTEVSACTPLSEVNSPTAQLLFSAPSSEQLGAENITPSVQSVSTSVNMLQI